VRQGEPWEVATTQRQWLRGNWCKKWRKFDKQWAAAKHHGCQINIENVSAFGCDASFPMIGASPPNGRQKLKGHAYEN
jgi:hypothetical protein